MKTLLISVLSIISVGAISFSIHSSNQTAIARQKWQADMTAAKAKLDDSALTIQSNQEVIAGLTSKAAQIETLVAVTNQLNEQLLAANMKIQDYEAADRNRLAVSPPVFTNNSYLFSEIVSVQNQVLATNVTFAYVAGRRLVFYHNGQYALIVDVDNIHPRTLDYLGLDAETIKSKQAKADADYAANRQAGAVIQAQYAKDFQAQKERDAALAIEKQKADAAAQAAWAAQQQAAADKEKADAAMLDAQKPPPQINVITQQRQTVY